MANNPKAASGVITAGWLSLNEIFPTAACSKTGWETASMGTLGDHGQENLGPRFSIQHHWDLALEAWQRICTKSGAEPLSDEALKDTGEGVPGWLSCLDPFKPSPPWFVRLITAA